MASAKRSFIVLGFGAVGLLAACGGKVVDIGGNSTSQQVTPSAVSVATSECPSGYEHSNICCKGGGDGKEATCESWPDDPFHPCADGWTTYPNAAACCSLDNPSDCNSCGDGIYNGPNQPVGSTPPSGGCGGGTTLPEPIDAGVDDGGTAGGGGTSSCDPRCPPGYTGISPYDVGGCCMYNADGSGECFGEARAGSTDAGVPDDAGTTVDDGGVFLDAGPAPDAGVNPGGPDQPAPDGQVCSIDCPPGWFLADVAGGVCCNNGAGGQEECFAVVFPDDTGGGGASTPPSGGSGGVNPGGPIQDASAP